MEILSNYQTDTKLQKPYINVVMAGFPSLPLVCESLSDGPPKGIYQLLVLAFGDLSELIYVVKVPLDSVDICHIWEINTGQHMLIMHCWLVLI